MDERLVRNWLPGALAAAFPERAPLAVDGWTKITSGWANNVYAFDLIDAKGQREPLVLKQFTVAEKARKEARALGALANAGYPVPRLWLAHDDLLVMERVKGESLGAQFQAADAAQRPEIAAVYLRLLVDLQALDARILAGDPTADAVPTREIERLRADQRPAFRPVIDWLDAHRVPCPRAVISHRDYHPWNVLVAPDVPGAPGGRAIVIDWDWEIADPRFDLAWTLTLMARSGFPDFGGLALYESLTGQPVTDYAYFEVLTTTRWLMNVTASLESGANLRSDAADDFRGFLQTPMRIARDLIRNRTGLKFPLD